MYYKIQCYIEVDKKSYAETVSDFLTMQLGCSKKVLDHVVISHTCAAKEARSAGLLRTTTVLRKPKAASATR